ncbi:coiled-coil domain-containing protein 166 isoform X2 [Denticeps clupeoides]|uniref:DUF4515 domain-containing protein n=1 Tax=Denticeps clupeoides TaxID=299321 RepID=A0AAY4D065_9TELE|nr:coiled-coil domain-containing protein 166 isoform X2 [Denticeps clupeoides]
MPPKKKKSKAKAQRRERGMESSTPAGSENNNTLMHEERRENALLQNEADRIRQENQEYRDYMKIKIKKRQDAIVTLNNQHQREMQNIQEKREEVLEKYEDEAREIKHQIQVKEKKLAVLKLEIADLEDVKHLRQQQLSHIAELEMEIAAMVSSHSKSLQGLKADAVAQKKQHEAQAQQKVRHLSQEAPRDAVRCLKALTTKVFEENQNLREELHLLFQRARELHDQQIALKRKQQRLLAEKEHVRMFRSVLPEIKRGAAYGADS